MAQLPQILPQLLKVQHNHKAHQVLAQQIPILTQSVKHNLKIMLNQQLLQLVNQQWVLLRAIITKQLVHQLLVQVDLVKLLMLLLDRDQDQVLHLIKVQPHQQDQALEHPQLKTHKYHHQLLQPHQVLLHQVDNQALPQEVLEMVVVHQQAHRMLLVMVQALRPHMVQDLTHQVDQVQLLVQLPKLNILQLVVQEQAQALLLNQQLMELL
jgi:hypothetical protein